MSFRSALLPDMPLQSSGPLARLQDIHLPEPIGWWPSAPGWWLLTVLVVVALTFTIICIVRKHRNNLYRRQALAELEYLYRSNKSHPAIFSHQLLALIRRTTIAAYPAAQLAPLPTRELLEAISDDENGTGFSCELRQQIDMLAYRKAPEYPASFSDDIYQATRQWLKRHRRSSQEASPC